MERSRRLVLTDWTKANDALNLYFEGNKSKLTAHIKMSRTTVTAFFKPEPVREAEFRKLCLALRLNWQEVSTVQAIPGSSVANAPQPETETDPLQQIREHCRQKILRQHSRMRLLSGEEIGVDQLYVDVWLLNRSPRTFQVSESKLLQTFDLRNDRLGLGDRIQRNPGFGVANANPKLLILGKPGSGKTTFLKHLAVDWFKGRFQPNLITVFIEFRRIRGGEWHLLDAIGKELGLDEGHQIRALKQDIQQMQRRTPKFLAEMEEQESNIKRVQRQLKALSLEILLREGKLLLLMDGLDEVPTDELRRNVQDQLREMAEEYTNNRWILTCRTQIIESIPVGFALVEVAEFSPKQVQQFVQNWFQASGQSDTEVTQQWQRFDNAVSRNSALKELTVTPVLLSLMCLVFHDEGEIPSQITELYKRAIGLLLNKWNDAKAIEGWKVGSEKYRKLSVKQKEDLLIKIAARKFENPENFVLFQQHEIVAQIAEFIRLSNRREGVAILKAIEAQHGLLIERAHELWSFSHFTFQEHFTLQWLTQLPSSQLAEKIANSRWQQVVEQLVKSQQPADRLLRLIKQSIDRSISGEPRLNQFLTWVLQKAGSIQTNDKPAALRTLYFALARVHARALNIAHDIARALNITYDLARAFDITHVLNIACDLNHVHACVNNHARTLIHDLFHARELARELNGDLARELARELNGDLALARNLKRNLDITHDHALAHNLERNLNITHDLNHALARDRNYDHALALARNLIRKLAQNLNHELAVKLEQWGTKLPSPENWQHFRQWWQGQGQQWMEDLQQVMIERRNMGYDWQFNEQQQQQLQRYYDANCFLIKLMQIEGAVSQEVRDEIEDSLLLPWDELQLRYPEIYGSNSSVSARQPARASDKEVFISYAWSGDSEAIVNHLDQAFQHKGITLVRDKRDLGFKGRIKEFMQRIGRGKCVVVVISEKYLKSENCMYELVQIAKNGEFYDRIFPIVLADANIYKPIQRLQYIQHWEAEINKLNAALKTVSAANLQGFRDEIDLYTEIRGAIAGLIDILKDMNTLTPEMHTESGFDQLFQAVERKLAE